VGASCSAPASRSRAPPTTATYALSLHDALPISTRWCGAGWVMPTATGKCDSAGRGGIIGLAGQCEDRAASKPGLRDGLDGAVRRSEEHTSELQSRENLVCRLLLEKKNKDSARGE